MNKHEQTVEYIKLTDNSRLCRRSNRHARSNLVHFEDRPYIVNTLNMKHANVDRQLIDNIGPRLAIHSRHNRSLVHLNWLRYWSIYYFPHYWLLLNSIPFYIDFHQQNWLPTSLSSSSSWLCLLRLPSTITNQIGWN